MSDPGSEAGGATPGCPGASGADGGCHLTSELGNTVGQQCPKKCLRFRVPFRRRICKRCATNPRGRSSLESNGLTPYSRGAIGTRCRDLDTIANLPWPHCDVSSQCRLMALPRIQYLGGQARLSSRTAPTARKALSFTFKLLFFNNLQTDVVPLTPIPCPRSVGRRSMRCDSVTNSKCA